MLIKRLLRAIGLLVLSVAVAQATTTLGELLDQGATKVGRDEWRTMLPFTTVGEWAVGRGESRLTYKSDGTFSGKARYLEFDRSSRALGTWAFDEAGRSCIDEQLPDWNLAFTECRFVFKLGADLYHATSDSDRNAPVYKRVVEK